VESPDVPLWVPPIQRTVAIDGTGVPELAQAIARHQVYLQQSGGWQQRERYRLEAEMESLLRQRLYDRWQEQIPNELYHNVLIGLVERRFSPQQAVDKLLEGGCL
jgi:LAO/AO transport system kinase